MTHNGQTRYIATNITIDSIKEFKSGRIVKRNDKDILNLQLKKICNQYEEKYAKIENADFLSCTQVYKLLIGPVIEQKCRSFESIVSVMKVHADKAIRMILDNLK